jgi:hypothetical protein
VREICAQLDAMRAAFGGRKRCIDRLDGRLDQEVVRGFH